MKQIMNKMKPNAQLGGTDLSRKSMIVYSVARHVSMDSKVRMTIEPDKIPFLTRVPLTFDTVQGTATPRARRPKD